MARIEEEETENNEIVRRKIWLRTHETWTKEMNRNDRSMTKVVRVSERTIFCCFFVFFISCWTWAKVMAMMTYVKARKSNVVFGGSPGSKTTTRKNIRKFLTKRYKLFHSPILVKVFVTEWLLEWTKLVISHRSKIQKKKKIYGD